MEQSVDGGKLLDRVEPRYRYADDIDLKPLDRGCIGVGMSSAVCGQC
ncbi:hypothetical protein [Streptomyces sp. NPDC093598]